MAIDLMMERYEARATMLGEFAHRLEYLPSDDPRFGELADLWHSLTAHPGSEGSDDIAANRILDALGGALLGRASGENEGSQGEDVVDRWIREMRRFRGA